MGRPLRVMYYVANCHRLAGAQRSLGLLLQGLDRREVEPLVVVPGEGHATSSYREAGIRVLVLRPPEPLRAYGGSLIEADFRKRVRMAAGAVLPYSVELAKLLRRESIDIAHFNDSRAVLMAGLAARMVRIPAVWHVRGDVRGLGASYLTACGLLSDRIILVADGVRSSVPERFRRKCVTVYNGIDPPSDPPTRTRAELVAALRPPVELRAGDVLVATLASLVPFKGTHHLLDACAQLADSLPSGRRMLLAVVGDRPDPAYGRLLDERMAKHDLRNVRFAGWDPEPLAWVQAADIVALPTVEEELLELDGVARRVHGSEGLPRVILEAMVARKPVVATRVAGVPELVVDGATGLLVPPGQPSALAAAIRRLAEAPEERARMGQAGLARVLERFSVAATVRGTTAIYRELASRPD